MAIFVDLRKAFDTLDHSILLQKLEHYGIRGIPAKLITSYITSRKQYVQINSTKSEITEATYGVPQGTVLGPQLFNMYINDLFDLRIKGETIAYADDTCIIYEHDTWQQVLESASKDFNDISDYFAANKLTVNYDKTVCVTFGCYEDSIPKCSKLTIHDTTCSQALNICACNTIQIVKHTKYLGVEIDNHLKWDIHINALVRKLRYLSHSFRTLTQILTKGQTISVYKAICQAVWGYSIFAWGGAVESVINPIETLNRKILKIIFRKKKTFPTQQLYNLSQTLDVRNFHAWKLLSYYVSHQLIQFQPRHISRRKHATHLAIVPFKRTSIGQRGHDYLGPTLFNKLPLSIREIISTKQNPYNSFKKNLLNFLINSHF